MTMNTKIKNFIKNINWDKAINHAGQAFGALAFSFGLCAYATWAYIPALIVSGLAVVITVWTTYNIRN